MKKEDRFILDIKRLGINGEGIGFYNRLAIFVPNAIPGEGHEVEITNEMGNMAFAKSIEVKHTSKNRVTPKCPYYEECGGCNTLHISYDKMLDFKRDFIIEAITRYTKLNPRSFEIRNTIPSKEQTGYRNRSLFNVRKKDETYFLCMPKLESNHTIPLQQCLVLKPQINELNHQILKMIQELDIPPYMAKFNRGVLRSILIRVNEANEAMVGLICAEKHSKIRTLAEQISKLNGVVSVYESFMIDKSKGEEINLLQGKPYLVETIEHLKFRIYPNSFFYHNTNQIQPLLNTILKSCKLSLKETVLEASCGVGIISLYLSKLAKKVIGIDYSKEAIVVAEENATFNHIKNTEFLQGDPSKLLSKIVSEQAVDCLVVNPPKTGLGTEFLDQIVDARIKRVLYVSTNPATLAKDLNGLSNAYMINSITPIDMFLGTAMLMCVCAMTLKDK